MMLAEFKNEKALSKKVCSETSFQKTKDNKSDSQKPDLLPVSCILKLPDKKCSRSLSDLCREVCYESSSLKRTDPFMSPERVKNNKIYFHKPATSEEFNNNRIARRRILSLLMLNAWRRQKLGLKVAQEKIENLVTKVEGYEMQVYVLRQLLNAEKKRVEVANDNIHDLIQKMEESNKEKSSVMKDNEELECNLNKLIQYCARIENTLRNQENYIITSRLEAENWEKQLEKEREKLKKMESEEIFLKEKVQINEKVILLKTQQVDQLTQSNRELQKKLDVQVPLWDETMAQVDLANAKLKESEEIKKELQKALEEKEKEIRELKSVIANLEQKLQEEDEKNGLLRKSITEKTDELTLVQKKFVELSKNSSPWSGGIVKVASLCAKIPVACICTVGSLLLPFPSYRL